MFFGKVNSEVCCRQKTVAKQPGKQLLVLSEHGEFLISDVRRLLTSADFSKVEQEKELKGL